MKAAVKSKVDSFNSAVVRFTRIVFTIALYFFAVVGAMFTYYNYKALFVEPFEKQVQVTKINAVANELPVASTEATKK